MAYFRQRSRPLLPIWCDRPANRPFWARSDPWSLCQIGAGSRLGPRWRSCWLKRELGPAGRVQRLDDGPRNGPPCLLIRRPLGDLFLDLWTTEPIWYRMLSRFAQENHPIVALSSAWPLTFGRCAAAHSLGRIADRGGHDVSDPRSRGMSGTVRAVEQRSRRRLDDRFISYIQACILSHNRFGHHLGRTRLDSARARAGDRDSRSMVGHPFSARTSAGVISARGARARTHLSRLAVYTSLGFLVVMIRLPLWSTYIEVLNNSPIVREFVLRTDNERSKRSHYPRQASSPKRCEFATSNSCLQLRPRRGRPTSSWSPKTLTYA